MRAAPLFLAALLAFAVVKTAHAEEDERPPPDDGGLQAPAPAPAPAPAGAIGPPAPEADLATENPDPGSAEPVRSVQRTEIATPPLGFLPTPDDALIDPRMARSWRARPSRWFLATTVDVGFVYARPRASFGYGKPFTKWAGIDLNPLIAGRGLGGYGGFRVEVPYVDIRVGARYFRSFQRTYLDPAPSFNRLQLETATGDPASVVTLESELDISIPAGPGNILGRGSVSYLLNVPEGKYVFEETLRVIVRPPLVWRGRGGYAFRLGRYRQHSIGFVVDILDVPLRDDSRTIRLGPIVNLVLSRRVELRGSFVATALSPDRLGLLSGDFTELGVRYRWASE